MTTRKNINNARVKTLQNTCAANPDLYLHEKIPNAQVINKLKILNCPIAKAGSTSMKQTLDSLRSKFKDYGY